MGKRCLSEDSPLEFNLGAGRISLDHKRASDGYTGHRDRLHNGWTLSFCTGHFPAAGTTFRLFKDRPYMALAPTSVRSGRASGQMRTATVAMARTTAVTIPQRPPLLRSPERCQFPGSRWGRGDDPARWSSISISPRAALGMIPRGMVGASRSLPAPDASHLPRENVHPVTFASPAQSTPPGRGFPGLNARSHQVAALQMLPKQLWGCPERETAP